MATITSKVHAAGFIAVSRRFHQVIEAGYARPTGRRHRRLGASHLIGRQYGAMSKTHEIFRMAYQFRERCAPPR
jgi:hypothetical protein